MYAKALNEEALQLQVEVPVDRNIPVLILILV